MNDPDEAIPLLTEEIEVGIPSEVLPSSTPTASAFSATTKHLTPEETPPFPPLVTPEAASAPESRTPAAPVVSAMQWELLAETVRGRVLENVRAQIDRTLDAQVAQAVSVCVERVVRELGDELHQALHRCLRETVDAALARELSDRMEKP